LFTFRGIALCRRAVPRSTALAAMPFCHLRLIEAKPKNDSYLWKPDHYPAHPAHIGEQIKKRRFDLKMTAVESCKILSVNKSTLGNWERGRFKPSRQNRKKIERFLIRSALALADGQRVRL